MNRTPEYSVILKPEDHFGNYDCDIPMLGQSALKESLILPVLSRLMKATPLTFKDMTILSGNHHLTLNWIDIASDLLCETLVDETLGIDNIPIKITLLYYPDMIDLHKTMTSSKSMQTEWSRKISI